MKKIFPLVFFLFWAACRVISDETVVESPEQPEIPHPFHRIDSLLCSGHQDAAVRLLRTMDPAIYGKADVLWRVVGAYNSRGQVSRCVAVLDSLQSAGWGDLTGWKISLLDMNRERNRALELVPTENVLLTAWLYRDSIELMPSVLNIPLPSHLGERAARLVLAPDGITSDQLRLAASDVRYLPLTVGKRVEAELALSAAASGVWWYDALKSFDPSETTDATLRLRALKAKLSGAGDYSYWSSLLDSPAELVAARVIASRWPDSLDWQGVDILAGNGDISLVASIASARNDSDFSVGVRMATLRNTARFAELEALCDSVSVEAPVGLRARAALFRARSFRARRRNLSAYRAYSAFAKEFPWHPTAREAAYLAGKYFDSEQNWVEAADAYLASLSSSGEWEGDARAHWRGGFSLYMSGRGALGDSLWRAGCEKYPFSYWVDEMLFWRARYAERHGNSEHSSELLQKVAAEHPWEYYGMLAAERGRFPYRVDLEVLSPVLKEDRILSVASDLFACGYGTAAVEMLYAGRVGDRALNAVALAVLGENGKAISALRSLDTEYRNAGMGILPDSLLGWYFPAPYRELAQAVTDTMALDAAFVEGIMREESYFNRFVVSRAGAAGLIQLMPGTAHDVARWNHLPALSPEDFFVPENSVLYGSLYINSQARRYEYPAVFLAAYNAGPGNAARWIDMHGFDPDDQELYIEQITYRETRMYAKKVQRSAWIYGRVRL